MGKQIKKVRPMKKSKWEKVCERCGNESVTPKKVFRCRYCNWLNGVGTDQYDVEITRGGIDL